ncbi:hypothetical protein R1flu_010084 [Riccia fluitans]|uniref:Uncharacterized protein n=1 Tax=Riccia fluitans TaxID=41844 RepID=A0ABD1Z869_9MARC
MSPVLVPNSTVKPPQQLSSVFEFEGCLARTYGLNWDQRFKICQSDIKAQCILQNKNWEAIADFGLALPVQLSSQQTSREEQSTSGTTQVATRIGGTLRVTQRSQAAQ